MASAKHSLGDQAGACERYKDETTSSAAVVA